MSNIKDTSEVRVESDRDWQMVLKQEPDVFTGEPRAVVCAYDWDASFELTATEARNLAAALVAVADRMEAGK